jgi:3-methyl-2-oxobutanoate hydroxymethyltransferase
MLSQRKGTRFPVITAYDAAFARCAEVAGIDVLLVGDSLGMVVLGHDSTMPVELQDIERYAGAVVRGSTRAHVVADLPFGSYESGDGAAVRSALALVKRARVSSVKLEGGRRSADRIKAIVGAGIPVMAHIGVLPQTAALTTGFRRQKTGELLLEDARAVEAAGAFAVVLEMVDAGVADEITRALRIPTIGIGSGAACDAQVLVMHDLLGLYPHSPPFARRYAELGDAAATALRAYANDVRGGSFP